MSRLVLTTFKLENDKSTLKGYEISSIPKIGEPVFVYIRDKSKKIEEDANANNISNRSIINKAFGYAKKDKFYKSTVVQVKSNNKNENGADFIDSRSKDLSLMYDYLSDLFLELLHKSTWNYYDTASKKYVLSTIDFDQCYSDLKMMIDSMAIILEKIINDKFDYQYSQIEVQNSIDQKNLDIQQMVKIIKK